MPHRFFGAGLRVPEKSFLWIWLLANFAGDDIRRGSKRIPVIAGRTRGKKKPKESGSGAVEADSRSSSIDNVNGELFKGRLLCR